MSSVMATERWPSNVWTVLGGSKREDKRLHMSLLEVENLRTYFKTEAGEARAVDGVSFTLEEGERAWKTGVLSHPLYWEMYHPQHHPHWDVISTHAVRFS